MPLATTLRSVTESNRKHWPIEFYILCDNFDKEEQAKVLDSLPRQSAKLNWLPVAQELFGAFSKGEANHVSTLTYARLLISKLFADRLSKVLFLDSDLLVLEDLERLWQTDLGEAPIGAVADFWLHTAYVAEGLDPKFKRATHPNYKGLPSVEAYFNAGVLLIDLNRWREEEISEKAFDYRQRCSHSPHMDQDALNVACDKRWKKLDARWNFQTHRKRKIEPGEAGIVHFITDRKPWVASNRNLNARLYDSFRSRTRFTRTPSEKVTDTIVRFASGVRNVLNRGGFSLRANEPYQDRLQD